MNEKHHSHLESYGYIKSLAAGNPNLVAGKIETSLALNGKSQYVNLGDKNNTCLGDLGVCYYGLTIGMWVYFRPPRFTDGQYVLYTGDNGASLYVKNGKLFGKFKQDKKEWITSVSNLKTGRWYFLELTWSPTEGATMYVDLRQVSKKSAYARTTNVSGMTTDALIGRSPSKPYRYANVIIDELEMWYGYRQDLLRLGFLLRGEVVRRVWLLHLISVSEG
jgi:hypothetical protein